MCSDLLILGSAPCLGEDLARIPAPERYDVMAIGLDAVDRCALPLQYVATNHPEDIESIRLRRARFGGNLDYRLVCYRQAPGADIVQPLGPVSGSSAILGAIAGITMGYRKIVLCGCPLTGNAPEGNPYEAFRPGWEAEAGRVKGRVFSMSGWTREFLGGPEEITVGAVWDGSEYYGPDYVNRLYASVARNTTAPFDFVLYAGPWVHDRLAALDPRIRVVHIGLPYWWSAMYFWRPEPPGVNTKDVLYLDLDQVITGDLDPILRFPSDHAYMKDYPADACPPGREAHACASTALIRNGAGALVWEEYVKAGMPQWNPLEAKPGRPMPMAVQTVLNEPQYGARFDTFPEDWVVSYRIWAKRKGIGGTKIVAFHGRPKPHEVDDDWVKENWR